MCWAMAEARGRALKGALRRHKRLLWLAVGDEAAAGGDVAVKRRSKTRVISVIKAAVLPKLTFPLVRKGSMVA